MTKVSVARLVGPLLATLLAGAVFASARSASAACSTDAECTAPPLVRCDPTEPGGVCVECLGDPDCKAPALCERSRTRAAFGKCVQCTETRAIGCDRATSGRACLSAGTCGCLSDDDCGDSQSLRVCNSGDCETGCRGDGSRGCAVGQSCTARGTGTGSCVPDPEGPPVRADAGPPYPSPPVGAGGGCSVAPFPIGAAPVEGASVALLAALAAMAVALRKRRALGSCAAIALLLAAAGCSRTPTPLRPGYAGSVGLPHRGVLIDGVRLEETTHVSFLRQNDRRWGTRRFVESLTRAAERVGTLKPGGAPLVLGDLSLKSGGVLLPHLSHRSGRDADILLYVTTIEGAPVKSTGFIHVREDGLAWDERGKRFLRFDVERQWLLLKTLLEDEDAHVQFVFASRNIRALLAEWAVARGETMELVYRALTVMVQPSPGGEHDDHFHVRTACTDEEVDQGCEPSGPERPWLVRRAPEAADTTELARALFEPLESPRLASPASVRATR